MGALHVVNAPQLEKGKVQPPEKEPESIKYASIRMSGIKDVTGLGN
jgi:hypothetical protein